LHSSWGAPVTHGAHYAPEKVVSASAANPYKAVGT